jgi:hypothetical protein
VKTLNLVAVLVFAVVVSMLMAKAGLPHTFGFSSGN